MKYNYNGKDYQGILPMTTDTLNTIKVSAATPHAATRVMAMVQNEDTLELWHVDAINIAEALEELARFYITEEPWADVAGMSVFRFVEMPLYIGALVHKLIEQGKIAPNEKQGGRLTATDEAHKNA